MECCVFDEFASMYPSSLCLCMLDQAARAVPGSDRVYYTLTLVHIYGNQSYNQR